MFEDLPVSEGEFRDDIWNKAQATTTPVLIPEHLVAEGSYPSNVMVNSRLKRNWIQGNVASNC